MILKDKVAIVTGSSRGIGAATARLLAANGARVSVNYHVHREKGEDVVASIRDGGGEHSGILPPPSKGCDWCPGVRGAHGARRAPPLVLF